MALIPATDQLTAASVTVALTLATPAQLLAANTERNGARLWADTANTQTVYVLYGTGTPSATNFHIALAPGASAAVCVDLDRVVWRGAVQAVSSAAAKVGVTES